MSEENRKDNWTVQELHSSLAQREGCCLIDVREYAEYAGGRIPGARLIPAGELERRALEIDRSKPVYVACRTGRRSAEAQRRLRAIGFEDVRNVSGGVMAWEAAGFAIERDDRAPWSLERQVRFVAGLIVLAGIFLSIFIAEEFIALSAFIGAGLVFASITDSCAMAMLLARMPWNRAKDVSVATCQVECAQGQE